jgi:ribosomal-protein-alanine N-acetyltransferase
MVDEFPQLETERLILRRLTMADVEFVFQHFSDPMIYRYLMDEEPMTDRSQGEGLIEFYLDPNGKSHNRWGIVLKAENALVGTCGFHKWDRQHYRAEIGYDLGQAHWGQGLMSEAIREALAHGFENMGLNKIDAFVYPGNAPSVRLLDRLGFQKEGELRDHYYWAGQFHDVSLFSLLKREWQR